MLRDVVVPSLTYFQLLLEFIRGVYWLRIMRRMSERSSCSASFGNVKISDLDFADDAVILAEALDILLGALEVLDEESEPLGLKTSWVKTKIQAFNDILDAAILSVPVCGDDVEVTRDSLTLAVIFMSLLAVSQSSIDIWVGPGESWIQ